MRLNASVPVSTALAVLALLTFDASAFGQQGTVAGTVTGLTNGDGIAAVQVQVLRRDGSVVATQFTGESGAYRIPGISPATYLVSFSATGWESLTETDVESYTVFDLNFGYEIPGTEGLRAQLDVQNVFDEGYQSFPGTPTIGRFTMLRLLWTP